MKTRKVTARKHSDKRVALIGFGSQGQAQAERLRANGYSVTIGLPPRSTSSRAARKAGFQVTTALKAIRSHNTVAILVPDHVGGGLLRKLGPHLEPGAVVVFAAGYALTFTPPRLPPEVDIVLVAPHGPGEVLRAGRQLSGFVGVFQDVSGMAAARAHAYAKAIGLSPVFQSDPRDEALGDLFGEQALLCGGLLSLTAAVSEVMLQHGLRKENVYFETLAQLETLSRLLRESGVDGFWREISDCAAAGAAEAGPYLIDAEFRARLEHIWQQIESGDFSRRFQAEGRPATSPEAWDVLRRTSLPRKKKGRPR